MLNHFGEFELEALLMEAIEYATGVGKLTPDVGGKATTKDVTEAVIHYIRDHAK